MEERAFNVIGKGFFCIAGRCFRCLGKVLSELKGEGDITTTSLTKKAFNFETFIPLVGGGKRAKLAWHTKRFLLLAEQHCFSSQHCRNRLSLSELPDGAP